MRIPSPCVLIAICCIVPPAFLTAGVADADTPPAREQNTASIPKKVSDAEVQKSIDNGIEFLKSRGADANGAFSGATGTAVTSLCVTAILKHRPAMIDDPLIKRSLAYLESNFQADGGVYRRGSKYRNYETSTGVLALVAANRDGRYDSQLRKAEAFLKGLQWDEGEGVESSDPAYGGAGYGSHRRPDLSNTSFMIDALKELGNGPQDPSIQKALSFLSRTQNLNPKTHNADQKNDTPHGDKINDGGFYYTPAAGGETKAEVTPTGGLRSYGSMTYAGLKSMIFAGLEKDDPRVVAAMTYIRNTYTLESNPGVGYQGLYYYYHTFAKALNAADVELLQDAKGVDHDWRSEIQSTLVAAQQSDGAWLNEKSERWMEGDRPLVTAYCLLALHYAKE